MAMTGKQIYQAMTYNQKTFLATLIVIHEHSGDWANGFISTNWQNNIQGDPFTIGVASWTGGEAWILLDTYKNREPDLYTKFPQSWRDAYDRGADDSFWFDSGVFTQADIQTWEAAANSDWEAFTGVQLDLIFTEDYVAGSFCNWVELLFQGIEDLGLASIRPSTLNTNALKATIAYMSAAMLCGPWSIYNCTKMSAGGNVETADWVSVMCYIRDYWGTGSGMYAQGWYNRFSDDINYLTNWDGVSGCYIPDTRPVDTDTDSGRGDIVSLEIKGNLAIVKKKACQMTLYKHPNGIFYPRNESNTEGSTLYQEWIRRVGEIANAEMWQYGYATSTHPWLTGYTDCSSWIISLALRIAPESELCEFENGLATGDWPDTFQVVAQIDYGDALPYDKMKPGDCIVEFSTRRRDDTAFPYYGHVELFMGTQAQGNNWGYELLGSGCAPAPNQGGFGYQYRTAQEYYDDGGCYRSSRNTIFILRPDWGSYFVDWWFD